ncbi:MAG: divergent polysaccharide deacetylase family protein [Rickettsiales bacterium]
MIDKEKYIFKKKHIPTLLSGVSFLLALVWVYIMLSGTLKEFDAESIKAFNGKKIVFSLKEHSNRDADYNKSLVHNNYEGKAITILMEFEDFSFIQELLENLPRNITVGVSAEGENFLSIKEHLNLLGYNYLIKLPLTSEYSDNPYSIYPKIDPYILSNRLDALMSGSRAMGVYNIGNEEFLENDLASFANIITFLNQKNFFMIYGFHGHTTIFESDSENIFSVEACDQIVDVRFDNKFQLLDKLKKFEESIAHKNKGVLFVKAVDYNVPEEVVSWMNSLSAKQISIVPANSLPRTLVASEGG